jgi:hypothetical protein
MIVQDQKFKKAIVELVAKRAANICSNPDCQALTSGPAKNRSKAINVGEAAHIYGANPRSARFRETLTEAERGDITNAIWLCCTCHKTVDSDDHQFPAALLFEWRRGHEQFVLEKLGKAGALLRQKVLAKELEPFASSSYLAQQIIIDKPDFWEYKLTVELLRSMAVPTIDRWKSLNRGLYTKPSTIVVLGDFTDWLQARIAEITRLTDVITGLVNGEIQASWGPPGQPGSETEILRVCALFAECCENILHWEEAIRFASVPSEFKEVQALWVGIGGRMMEQLEKIPIHLSEIFSVENPSGVFELNLTLDLPAGWVEECKAAMERATARIEERGGF